jgi:hypothetical protein
VRPAKKPKSKNATTPAEASPSKSSDLRGWAAIAQFLGMPNSTVHRWTKEGMPVGREGRKVVANPEELNRWLQRTSGEAAGVHVVTPSADLLKDLRASVAAQRNSKHSPGEPMSGRLKRPVGKAPKAKATRKSQPETIPVRLALSRCAN